MSCSCHKHHKEECTSSGKLSHAHDEHQHGEHNHDIPENDRIRKLSIGISIVFLIASFFVQNATVQKVIRILAYLAAGIEVLIGAVKSVISGDFFDEEALMTIATIGAISIGDYTEAVAVMLLYRIGEWIQDYAVERSKGRIAMAVAKHPDRATVERAGKRISVNPKEISVGETVIVGVGERIPVDGIVTEGTSRLDCAALTGESKSVRVVTGDAVYAGSINVVSEIRIKATVIADESSTARLLKAVDDAAETKPKMERFITRFSKIYTPCVVALALIVAVIPPVLGAGSFREWIHRALTFLVISCPCALVLSVPLTFYCGLAMLTKRELLPKAADVVERLANIKAAAFDKTGTLTTGAFSVLSVHSVRLPEKELLAYAAMAERNSPHPIARAIVLSTDSDMIADETEEHVGKGVTARKGELNVTVGNEKLFTEMGISVPQNVQGVLIALNGEYQGSIETGDTVRDSAAKAVSALYEMSIKTYMLTGDNTASAEGVAGTIGIANRMAGLFPEEKVEMLHRIRETEGSVAFIGDGMNDAPVLRNADVGIAMAERGSEMASETADILLLSGNLNRVPESIQIARRTVRVARLNVILALAIKLVAMILSACGLAGMWVAVVADSGAALLCVLLSLTVYRDANKK